MKLFKKLLVVLFVVFIASCSSNDTTNEIYNLTNANIAGTYNIGSLNIDLKATAITSGVPVTISTAKNIGDTFQVDFVMNVNGTYTASGQYRVVTTVTPITGAPITNSEIVVFSDSGSYNVNATTNEIGFTSKTDEFLDGTFKVTVFNENTFTLTQEFEEVDGSITTNGDAEVSFVRK
jgi:hypothetical protein